MKLEFEDILNKELKNEIKHIEKTVDKAFSKKEKSFEKYSKKMLNFFKFPLILSAVLLILAIVTSLEIFSIMLMILFVTIIFGLFYGSTTKDIIDMEKKQVKLIKSNKIFEKYENKKRNINGKRINKVLDTLSPKQKEILRIIDENNKFKKPFEKIKDLLIKEKIKNTSNLEFGLKKEFVMENINKIKKEKNKGKYLKLIKKHFGLKKQEEIKEEEVLVMENAK